MLSAASLLAVVLSAISSTMALSPAAVNIRTAANYAVLAQTGISTVPTSSITGDIGLSPAASSFLTGFALTLDSTTTFATSSQVVGKVFSASYTPPTPSKLTTAVSDSQAAYTDAAGRLNPTSLNPGAGAIGGSTFLPGLYKFTTGVTVSGNVAIVGTVLDTIIFQIAGTLNFAPGAGVILTGILPKNVIWAVAGASTFGSGSNIAGTVLGKSAITLQTGATLNGRALAQSSVALQKAVVVGA